MWVDATVAAGFLAKLGSQLLILLTRWRRSAQCQGQRLAVGMVTGRCLSRVSTKQKHYSWSPGPQARTTRNWSPAGTGWAGVPFRAHVPPPTERSSRYQEAAPFAPLVLKVHFSTLTRPTPARDEVPYTGVQFVAIPAFQGIGTDVSQFVGRGIGRHDHR